MRGSHPPAQRLMEPAASIESPWRQAFWQSGMPAAKPRSRPFEGSYHQGIVNSVKGNFAGWARGISRGANHGQHARPDSPSSPDPVIASDPDDGRAARGKGEAQALAGAQVGKE